jgi:spermidine synthase
MAMSSWRTLGRAVTGDGSELTLCRLQAPPLDARLPRFSLRVDGQDLMHSNSHGSEEKLAVHGCAGLTARSKARVLVGGLGMGFTARAALDCLARDAEVVVVEAVAEVIAWNRDPDLLGQLAAMPLADRRLSVVKGDVGDVIERAAAAASDDARFDAILLDVDNGPTALSTFTNKRLYSEAGLASARLALRGGGVLAVWSTFADAQFTARLRATGFAARTMRVLAGDGTSRRHILWLARPAGGGQSGLGRDVSSRNRYRTPTTIV